MKLPISICIPAYKRPEFLKRLLDSIAIQTYQDFEVIVTDDSPDQSIKILCGGYQGKYPLSYVRNERALGSPENWNEAVRRARGEWIKIMHDDDWFAESDSLAIFATSIARHPEASFIFAAYRDVFLDKGKERKMFVNPFRYRAFIKNKATLLSQNIVGPPSVVLYRKDPDVAYDPRLKWLVDIDFYIRYLSGRKAAYIDKVLVNVGLGEEQVTRDCFRLRPVEIPENFYLLNKLGGGALKNIWVYDAWWRLMRNLEISRPEDISGSGYSGEVPEVILSMIRWQNKIGRRLLSAGPFSKTCMFLHYLSHSNRIPS
jgi:glycosyltransferase involved in cell wall biosynthesis